MSYLKLYIMDVINNDQISDIISVSITDSAPRAVYGEVMGRHANIFESFNMALFYVIDDMAYRESNEIQKITSLMYDPKIGPTTYGFRWNIYVNYNPIPVNIIVACWPKTYSIQSNLIQYKSFYNVDCYSLNELKKSKWCVLSNLWSIVDSVEWLTNFRLDSLKLPNNKSYGTFEVKQHYDFKRARIAVVKHINSEYYKVLFDAPVEIHQVYTTIFEWTLNLTQGMLDLFDFKNGDTIVLICYDYQRQAQLFGLGEYSMGYRLKLDKIPKNSNMMCITQKLEIGALDVLTDGLVAMRI